MNEGVTDQGMAILFGFWAILALVFVWFCDRIDGQQKARRSGHRWGKGRSAPAVTGGDGDLIERDHSEGAGVVADDGETITEKAADEPVNGCAGYSITRH